MGNSPSSSESYGSDSDNADSDNARSEMITEPVQKPRQGEILESQHFDDSGRSNELEPMREENNNNNVQNVENGQGMFSPALKPPKSGDLKVGVNSAFSPVRRTRKRSKKALAVSSSTSLVSPPLQPTPKPTPQAPLDSSAPSNQPKTKSKTKSKSKSKSSTLVSRIFGSEAGQSSKENEDPNPSLPPPSVSGKVSYVCHDDEENLVTTDCVAKVVDGTKCYIVDEKTGCFVFDLLTPEECRSLIQSAESHVQSSTGGSGWRKLYTYTKMDLPMQDLANAGVTDGEGRNIKESLMRRICSVIGSYYGCSASALRPRTWKEPHFLKYSTDVAPPHCGVEMHYDGCNITWNLMLSDETDYDGGGTYIRCLRKTVKLLQGQVLIHPGELFHKGVDITRGTRYLAVCFVDGHDPEIQDLSSGKGNHELWEKNTVTYFG
ncbi:hypothetical protein TrVE_jg547 [Triparma verrucosa]|uniref:Fe2OG dioxygenase domain-containing protein n=1 Tax=Triparma verrucosa TaxID=1606542 RepID=A0A9W7EJC7_9STRA|nr:hypothetical protein TrVE_jg547 [Triparma verrucosa]